MADKKLVNLMYLMNLFLCSYLFYAFTMCLRQELYKSLWKAGPDQRAKCDHEYGRYPDVAMALAFTETIGYQGKGPNLYSQSIYYTVI